MTLPTPEGTPERAPRAAPEGVLVVDKPRGMTSHDVVARVRRLLKGGKSLRVGHAGTLDPLATGVLVVLVGEATKLGAYLTADDKRYRAEVRFGRATDTLDADGATTVTGVVPPWLLDELREAARDAPALGPASPRLAAALAAEVARVAQVPPAYSAIHVAGRRSHDLARAGEAVALEPRPVAVRALAVVGASGGDLATEAPGEPSGEPGISLDVHVSKGYYVRALARDLGERLGVPAHLASLRRLSSGTFDLDGAVPLDAGAEAVRAALIPIAVAVANALPVGRLTAEGAARARQGKRLAPADFSALPPVAAASAWIGPDGRLTAIGARLPPESATDLPMAGASFAIHRGFRE